MSPVPAVELAELVKTFRAPGSGTLTAVDGVSFAVEQGVCSASSGRTGRFSSPVTTGATS